MGVKVSYGKGRKVIVYILWNAMNWNVHKGWGAHLCAGICFGVGNWNVHKSRASERAAFAYIMSDGVLFCTYL